MPRDDEVPGVEAWDAWQPPEVAQRLAGVSVPWCVVGGWALDLWHGAATRSHEDLEIAVSCADLPAVQRKLAGFRFYSVVKGQFRFLAEGEEAPADSHQNWVLDGSEDRWRLDVMLEPGDAATWIYRKDESLQASRTEMVETTSEGIPYLLPHGTLLFKSRGTRPKDEADFEAALPKLPLSSRRWLLEALEKTQPGHHWIDRLAMESTR
ncbi:hypothetical protein BH11ARM2_BH11ARM2_00360 [soil metagenome]